jgi:CRISPR-associated protein Cas5t
MQVLKVVAEGLTTSFRHPHFMQGIQPTFRLPPPATIYGHLCSAIGDVVPPDGLAFAYHFTSLVGFSDIEHTHIVSASGGRLEGTTLPKALEGSIQPFKRSLLFQPRLVLYVNRPEWVDTFRSPRYAVVLGRSQDLFTYTTVETVELQQAERAYFEHTLLPYAMAARIRRGIVELMPRYLDYARNRQPTFARYLLLEHRVHSDSEEFLRFDSDPPPIYWIDPTSPPDRGAHLGLIFHTFTGEEYQSLALAPLAG